MGVKIKTMNKADWHLFWLVIKKTAVTQEWVAAELGMGSRANVSRAVRRIEDEKDPGILERKKIGEYVQMCTLTPSFAEGLTGNDFEITIDWKNTSNDSSKSNGKIMDMSLRGDDNED